MLPDCEKEDEVTVFGQLSGKIELFSFLLNENPN